MPVVGANQIKARIKSFVSDVSDKKALLHKSLSNQENEPKKNKE